MAILNKACWVKKKKVHPVFDLKEPWVLFLIWPLAHEEAHTASCSSWSQRPYRPSIPLSSTLAVGVQSLLRGDPTALRGDPTTFPGRPLPFHTALLLLHLPLGWAANHPGGNLPIERFLKTHHYKVTLLHEEPNYQKWRDWAGGPGSPFNLS